MPLFLPAGKIIFFVHVPKTGGSSVEDYLLRRCGRAALIDRHKRAGVRATGLISPITHLSALDLEEVIPPGVDLCFSLVRDPLARSISEYGWQSGASRLSRNSFSTWLRVAIAAARREPRIYENHIRPQAEMIPENAEIFRLENGLDAVTARVDALLGTTAPEIAMGHFKNRQRDAAPITIFREDAELISDYYAADYERFGYDLPELSRYASDPAAGRRDLFAAPLARLLVAKQRRDWLR